MGALKHLCARVVLALPTWWWVIVRNFMAMRARLA